MIPGVMMMQRKILPTKNQRSNRSDTQEHIESKYNADTNEIVEQAKLEKAPRENLKFPN